MKKVLCLIIGVFIFANVSVTVNKKEITQGDKVIFTITADGKDVKLPDIDKIGPYKVIGTSNNENITIINGKFYSSLSKSYVFAPTKDVVIPSFKVIIDGKTYYTKPIKIKVDKLKKTNDKDYDLSISIDKNETYLGEGRVLTIIFSKSMDANPQSIQLQKPNLENFIIKQISAKQYNKNDKEINEYKFLIIPQKSGRFVIGPLIANIGILDNENPFDNPFFAPDVLNYKKIVSNEVSLNVKPIPKESIWGEFNITLKADKKETMADTPIKIELEIKGCGDFYHLPDFKLPLKDATVYEKKPILKLEVKDNKLCGVYKKEFDIISDRDLNISGVSLLEFNGSLNYVKSNPLFIKIDFPKTSVKIENFTNTKREVIYRYKNNYWLIGITFIIGILIGLSVGFLLNKFFKQKKESQLIDKIKKADEKELFRLLLPYYENKEIEEILKQLEKNIYKNEKNRIDKKRIIKIIKSL